MNNRQKIAHLLRRFGLGASQAELDFYEPLGVEGTIDRLINFEKTPDAFNISAWALAPVADDGRRRFLPQHVTHWWIMKMITTPRPLEEKLAIFWHDHFAVSAQKVQNAPFMYQYIETIRKKGVTNFEDLLIAMTHDPAMIEWLDTRTNVKGKPNENFAREIMELFTLGEGNYTEEDIQEAARAFTGLTFRFVNGRNLRNINDDSLREVIERGEPLFESFVRINFHDTGIKKILGNEGNFDPDKVCGLLSARPETAKYITTKLWEFFAYQNPEPRIQERLSRVFLDGGLNIRKVLFAIAQSDEFWSDKCINRQVKSPIDFTISILRQLGVGSVLLRDRLNNPDPLAEVPRSAIAIMRVLAPSLNNQGMMPLHPPDVAGWDWGEAWISSATMIERIKFGDIWNIPVLTSVITQTITESIFSKREIKTGMDFVKEFLLIHDANIPNDRMQAIVSAFEKAGGISALNGRRAGATYQALARALYAVPEFHFC